MDGGRRTEANFVWERNNKFNRMVWLEAKSELNLGSWTVGDDADLGELGLRVVAVMARQASGCGPSFFTLQLALR